MLPDPGLGPKLGILLLLAQGGRGREAPPAGSQRKQCWLSFLLSFAADVAFPFSPLAPLSSSLSTKKTHHPFSSLSLALNPPPPAPPPHPPLSPDQTTTGRHGRRRPEEEPEHLWGHHQRRGAPREAGSFFFVSSSFFFKISASFSNSQSLFSSLSCPPITTSLLPALPCEVRRDISSSAVRESAAARKVIAAGEQQWPKRRRRRFDDSCGGSGLLRIRSSRSSRRAPSSTPSTPATSGTPWRASSTSRTSWRACTTRR